MSIDYINEIEQLIDKWQPSGALRWVSNEMNYCREYGFADRSANRPMSKDDTYRFDLSTSSLSRVALLLCADLGYIALDDTLDKYLPEYKEAKRIKITDLIEHTSVIPDYFFGKITLEMEQKYTDLSYEERYIKERVCYATPPTFAQLMESIGDEPLPCTPGEREPDSSASERIFIAEIIKRAVGKDLFDFCDQHLFKKAGIRISRNDVPTTASTALLNNKDLIPMPVVNNEYCVVLSAEDMVALGKLFAKGVLSKKMMKYACKTDQYGDGLVVNKCGPFLALYGFHGYMGNTCSLLFNPKDGAVCVLISNETGRYEFSPGYPSYDNSCINVLTAANTVFDKPKMEKITRKLFWDAVAMSVHDNQRTFVGTAVNDIAWGLLNRHAVYLVTQYGTPVGLLILKINKEKNEYYVDTVLIDKLYQGKGYGKFMMRFAVDYLHKKGGSLLGINCNRHNTVARHLYESVGFKVKELYSEGVYLTIE